MGERKIASDDRHFDIDLGDGDLQASVMGQNVDISIRNDWYGSTETGFGATLGITLTREEAITLGRWLIERGEGKDA